MGNVPNWTQIDFSDKEIQEVGSAGSVYCPVIISLLVCSLEPTGIRGSPPALSPPASTAPQLTGIRTLGALSAGTGETREDLLDYTSTELDEVFALLKIDVIGKRKIRREMDALRQ